MEIPDDPYKIYGDDFARGMTEQAKDEVDIVDKPADCEFGQDCEEINCIKSICKDYQESKKKTNRLRKGDII